MDPDLLLAIALSESLMQENIENNGNNNNNNNNKTEGNIPGEIDRLNIYFKDLLSKIKKEGGSVNVKPLYSTLKWKTLSQEQLLFLSKVLEYISFLIIDGKGKDLNVNTFSRNAIEFCLNTLERWCTGEIQFSTTTTTSNKTTSSRSEEKEKQGNSSSNSGSNTTVMILLSIIDMLCCIEFPSSDIDKSFFDQIPSFLSLKTLVDDILPTVAETENKEDTSKMAVDKTTTTTTIGADGLESLFSQFLKDGLAEEKSMLITPSKVTSPTTTNTTTAAVSNSHIDSNETLVKNNSHYFNNVLKGPSRLLSICSRLLLPYQSDLVISEKYEDFKKSETTTCSFINYVQDILFSEGFDTLDISSIPWIIDFIGRLIGTSRSYQSYDLKNHLSYRNSRFLSRQLFEMIFQVLGTKLNHPELRIKAEIFFSLCILSDAEKLNINIDDLISQEKQQSNNNSSTQEMILDPQLILLAITLIFNHLEEFKSNEDDDNNSIGGNSTGDNIISIGPIPNNNNKNNQPITKFLISNLDNESIWFDFLTPKQFTYLELSNLFMKSQLLDSLFSILYISFQQKRKDITIPMDITTGTTNVNNNNTTTPITTTTTTTTTTTEKKEEKTTGSKATTTDKKDDEDEDDSYDGDIFGLLFSSDEIQTKSPLKVSSSTTITTSSADENNKNNINVSKSSINLRKSKEGDIIKSKFYTILSYIHDLVSNQPQFIQLLQKDLKLSHLKGLYELLSKIQKPDSWTLTSASVQKLLISTCYLFTKNDVIRSDLQLEFIDFVFKNDDILTLQKDKLKWLAWMFVKRQTSAKDIKNDYLVKKLWENFTDYLKNSFSTTSTEQRPLEFTELISIEYIYFILFSFHTLDEEHRCNVVKCFVEILQLILNQQNHQRILSNSLLISRFLMIFNYVLFNFNSISKSLSNQFYENLLSCNSSGKQQQKSENYYLSLVTLTYKQLISQLEKKSISSTNSENIGNINRIPIFYEIKFTDSTWLQQSEVISQIFNKISISYDSFYKNILLLTSLLPPAVSSSGSSGKIEEDKDLSFLYYDYFITSTLQFLYTLPTSNEFQEKIKDSNLFNVLTNESSIHLTFLKSIYTHQSSNPSLYQSIPWFNHTKNILSLSTRKQLLNCNNNTGIFRNGGIVQCVQSYLCTLFNTFDGNNANNNSSSQSDSNKSGDNSIGEFLDGWDHLFDEHDDDEEEEKTTKKSGSSDDSKEVEMKDSSLSPSKSKTITTPSFNDLLPDLFTFLIEFLSSYKSLYRESLINQLKNSNESEDNKDSDCIELILDIFSSNSKSEVIKVMESLKFSQEQRSKVDKWDSDYNLDDSHIQKSQKQLFGWILQPYSNSSSSNSIRSSLIGSLQYLIKSQLVLSMYAMDHLDGLEENIKSQDPFKEITSQSLSLLYEIFDFEYDNKFNKFSKNHQDVLQSDLSPTQYSFLTDLHRMKVFEEISGRILKISGSEKYKEILENASLQSILDQHVTRILLIVKNNPVHIYSHYISGNGPMGSSFKVQLPVGDSNLLFWILMNNSNESLNVKVLTVFNNLMSLPIPSDFLVSMRSHIVSSLLKLPVEDLGKWFEQKLLGRISSSDQKLIPSTIEIQELMVRFIGLITNNQEFAKFNTEVKVVPSTVPVQTEVEKDLDDDKSKKKKAVAQKKKDDKSTTPPLTSTPPTVQISTPTEKQPEIDWNEKLPSISPLILEILLSMMKPAFNQWVEQPKLLRAYFGLLLYTDTEQHQLLRLFREVSKLESPIFSSPNSNQLESLNYILEFIENVFKMIQSIQVESSNKDIVVESTTSSTPDSKDDQIMSDIKSVTSTTTDENILFDATEEEVDNDKTNFEDEDGEKDWKSNSHHDKSMNGDSMDADDNDEVQSDEKKLSKKLCTYTYTKNEYLDQHWYFCYTCGLKFSEGCCSVCVKVCHKGHAVSYSRFSRFFCDCGAGAGKNALPCKALKPRSITTSPTNQSSSSNNTNNNNNNNNNTNNNNNNQSDSCCSSSTSTTGYFFNLPTENDKISLKNEIMNDSTAISKISELYHKLIDLNKTLNSVIQPKTELTSKIDLFSPNAMPKDFISKTDLFTLKKASKYSAFDAKLKLEGPEGNQLKSLIATGPIQRAAITSNSKSIVAVAEQDNVSLVNISKILDDDSTIDKNSFKVLSKTSVGFPVVSMLFNPSNERYLAVAGYKECKILTINQKDEIVDQLPIDLSLEFLGETNYIIRVEWIIGSQVELVVVTNEFIKVYDLSKDNISPSHFFSLLEDSIRDVCLVCRNNKNYILALSASGLLYCQSIDPYSDDNESCIMIETLQLPVVKSSPGVSVFNCQDLDMIICSFTNGECFAVEINQQMTEVKRTFSLQDPTKKIITPAQGFIQLTPSHPSLFSGLAYRGTYLITMKFAGLTGKEIQIQSLKLTLKVEGMTWVNKTSPKLLVLYDDGSLARYDYSIDNTLPQQSNQVIQKESITKKVEPVGLDIMGYIKEKQLLKNKSEEKTTTSPASTTPNTVSTSSLANIQNIPQFPIDFFERTECITNNVKYGGDPLNTFTQEVIKQKLASNDDYIICQNLDSLSLIIYNNDAEKVICGIRVLLGNACLKNIPTELRVYNRVIPVTESMRRWYDIPLTIEESSKSAKKVTIVAGPTYTMGNSPIIDQVEVYAINKDHLPTVEEQQQASQASSAVVASVIPEILDIPLNQIELSLLHSLHSMYSYFSMSGFNQHSEDYLKLKQSALERLPSIITETKLSFLRPIVKDLLKILSGDHDSYLNLKHSTLLKYTSQIISTMSKSIQGNSITLTDQDTDTLFYLVKVLKKIVTEKPKNLTEYLLNDKPNFLADLIQIYRIATSQFSFNKTSPTSNLTLTLLNDQFINNLSQLIWYCLKLKLYSCSYIFDLLKSLLNHPLDLIRTKTSLALVSLITNTPDSSDNKGLKPSILTSDTINSVEQNQNKKEDVQMEDEEVLYHCDNCSTVDKSIVGIRWHCEQCGDFDLCDNCHSKISHDKSHKFIKYLGDEIVKDQQEQEKPTVQQPQVNDNDILMNLDDDEIDEELKLAISMSLNVDSPIQSPTSSSSNNNNNNNNTSTSSNKNLVIPPSDNEDNEDSILLIFKYSLNELVTLYDKGFSGVMSYLQIIHSLLINHSNKILSSPTYSNHFVKIVFELLSKPTKNQLDKYLSQKTLSLESDTNLILLLAILLDSDVNSHNDITSLASSVVSTSTQQSNTKTHLSHVFIYQLCNLFQQAGMADLLKLWLESIFKYLSKSHSTMGQIIDSPFGSLLSIQQSDSQNLPKNRYSPFFIKSLPRDINNIVLIISKSIFILMTSFYRVERRKKLESQMYQGTLNIHSDWVKIACGFIHSKKAASLDRYPKKLLLLLCRTKPSYYSVRDEYLLKKKYNGILEIEKTSKGFQDDLNYDHLTKLISSLSLMLEVAYDRPKSWQYFVSQNQDVLSNLFNILFKLDPEPTSLLLELLTYVFVDDEKDIKSSSSSNNNNNIDSIEPMDIDMKAKHVSVFLNEKLLNSLIYNLLLDSNLSDLRSNASNFLYYLWKSSDIKQKLDINKLFWSKLDKLVAYGKNSNEFMELLTYFVNEIDAASWKDQYEEFADKFIQSFSSQNAAILNHPNSQIYNSLSFILDFEDYYLEAEPCLVCNNPEVQYQTVRLDTLKQEVKFTESAQLIKFNNVYNIQKLQISIHDLKKGKMIKSINLYYNNKPVADIGDLKGKFNQWKKLKQVHFAPSQTERTINFQIPISARNFMIEYFDFHDNLSALSGEKLTCPRCSRIVTDKHGICKHCHENAFQCKQCRNINYENLDGFLCNECGFCKHARFEFSLTCKPTVSIEKIENQEDHKRAIQTIDKESENAHKKYQRLIGFKKIISNLITSFQTQEQWPKEELFVSQQQQQLQQQAQQIHQQAQAINATIPASTTAATTAATTSSNTFLSLRINKKIGYLSRLYEKECKNIFEGLSKSIQILQTNRTEIAKYLHSVNKQRLQSLGGNHVHDDPRIREPNNCFGCSNCFIEESLSFLNHLSRNPNLSALKEILVSKGLTKEIFQHNVHHGKSLSRTNARLAISYLTKNNLEATDSLNNWIRERILYALDNYNNVDVPNLVSAELLLLKDCSLLSDQFWQQRFRFIMEVFFKSIERGSQSPVISEFIILPCLKIVLSFCTIDSNVPKKSVSSTQENDDQNQKSLQSKFEKLKSRKSPTTTTSPEQPVKPITTGGAEAQSVGTAINTSTASSSSSQDSSKPISVSSQDISLFEGESSVKYDDWLTNPDSFDQWSQKYSSILTDSVTETTTTPNTSTKSERREKYLLTKYFNKWRLNLKKYKSNNNNTNNPLVEGLFEGSWVKKLLFNSTSSIRTETLMLMSILSRSSPIRTLKFLDLFEKMIPFATTVGEYSAEFFGLFNKIIQSDERKLYLTVRGFIPYLCDLIVKEIERIKSKESSFNTDVSQGFVLKTLITILMGFMEVNTIKMKMKRDNIIEMVLDAFLSLRGVIIQKNKLTEDSVRQLQEIMKILNTESVEDNKKFMAANIKALSKHSNDGRTPIFIYEQLCNIVCPTKPEPVYQLILNKSATQDEYIRGGMNRNPYSSASLGLLMRDVKNKICKTLDLGSFLEDDSGMELLVDNKIIKLDLPIKKVYEQIWRRSPAVQRSGDINMPMSVVYRLQGLDGEATEEIIENLPDSASEEKDPEEEFEITSVFAGECSGLNAMLLTIESINDFTVEKELANLVVKLLFHCCKIKVNRQKLILLNTVARLLEKLKNAFHQPDIAENLLIIIESVVTEANKDYNFALSNSGSGLPSESLNMQAKDVEEAKEQMLMFLDKLNSPLVRSNPKIIKAMTRIIPFLTYGHVSVMESLVAFFDEFLNFKAYDSTKSQDSTFTYHLDFFAQVTECIRPDSNGCKLRSLILERGITQTLVDYIIGHFPEDKDKTSQEWLDSLQAPSLPFVLVIFRGLAMGHEPTQTLAAKSNIIKRIHVLEETSTSAKIGSLSENLLETLMEGNDDLTKLIKTIRKDSKSEKLRQAEKHREDVLKELGLSQTGKHITASTVPGSIEDLEEDEGFTCMVCREGFSFKPEDVLGIYTYTKRIPLMAMNETTLSNSSLSSSAGAVSYGFTTVTHFNIIHFFCHRDATKADRSMKVPKEEWEGAALRNQQTKCNNIFPIQGPKISNDAFTSYSDKYFTTLNNLSRFDSPRFRILAHDLKLLILRFSKDESFSVDSKGGGKESNIRIVPFFVQFGMFLLDQKITGGNAANQLRRPHFDKLLQTFLSLPLETATLSMVQSSSSDNVPYFLVLSLYLLSPKEWQSNKFNYLTRILLYAFAEYFSTCKQPSSSEEKPTGEALFQICRPWLIFYSLVFKFHQLIRPESLNLTEQNWIVEQKSYLANSSNKIQSELKGILSSYQDELKEYADFMEFFDDLSLLKNVMEDSKDPNQYALKLYQSIRKLSITN